jgi:hypothetical protein
MEKTVGMSYESKKQVNRAATEEYSLFDEVMENVTNRMFKIILFGGIPFFLWVFIQSLVKF